MKFVYPVIFCKTEDKVPYFVEIPDLNAMTQGTSLENAIEMAKNCIEIHITELMKRGKSVPSASEISKIITEDKNAIISLVEVDID